ncbi:ATP-dependent zinc metalloprotease FtsH [Nitratifractor salsuginis]|uniref:ATP-dependent zinc metalloprotease FtsH n=1 Tax=Nitratifractor salsuginis (strain DSM 16511 / JCM 12458 / E9I37-1) TaxID=749222 RepID=E6X172_NITSE|nr:ATP-dependent zinc metalloprotease FtsH [Nitratifractor salsuginis]ADV46934.1 membrane protease FtsH catalytic subunit [Nitratifractor salsuginis DSM 16511]
MAKKPNDNKNNKNFFNDNPLLAFALFSIVIILVFKLLIGDQAGGLNQMMMPQGQGIVATKKVTYSAVKNLAKEGKIQKVKITPTTIEAIGEEDGRTLRYIAEKIPANDPDFIKILDEKHIEYSGVMGNGFVSEMISMLLPIFIFFAIWIFLAKRMSKGMGGGILGVGKAGKLINSEKPNVKFDDVAGVDEAKEEVKEIVDFLKYPERYIALGAKIPKGVLLVGPPGTGKTLLAKAVAGEASVPFFSVSGSSFIEMFVGVGASRVRDLFEQAKKEAPSIIFIDEIDAIGKSRTAGGPMGGNDEREQTLNQLLAEMDGFGSDTPVIVLAATNRPEVLDPALLRAGRFDRQVLVDKPDFEGRLAILKIHSRDVKLAPDVDLEEVAKATAGLAGADLANIINEAALLAGRQNKKQIEQSDLMEAIERAFVGLEKKNRKINDLEKRIVSYHESGHALMAELTEGATRVTKVSIIPRGLGALGYTLHLPDEENRFLKQKHELLAEIDVLLGGRASEEIFIGDISTGAGNDLQRATDIIKDMITKYGMSDVAGLMVLEKNAGGAFLNGGQVIKDYSEKTAEAIDEAVKKLLDERYKHVKSTLKDYAEAIHEMAKVLLDVEVIEGCKVREIIEEFEKRHNLPSRLAHKDKVEEERCAREERAEKRAEERKGNTAEKPSDESSSESESSGENDEKQQDPSGQNEG